MSEKVLQEIRFIETNDGFRIEAKGDKEQLKAMGLGPGMFGFGPKIRPQKTPRRTSPSSPWPTYAPENVAHAQSMAP